MARTFLALGFLATQIAVSQWVYCRPPDQVMNSPIPPLKEPPTQRSLRSTAQRASNNRILPSLPLPRPVVVKPSSKPPAEKTSPLPEDYLTEQSEIWNSSAMGEARSFVMEFGRRSAQTSAEEADRFIQQLSTLPPAEMKSWLRRYQERRKKSELEREVDQFARRLMVEQTLNRQDAMRQASAEVSQLRAEATAAMQMRPGIARGGRRQDTLTFNLRPNYDPMYPVVDPAMHLAEKILRVPIEQAAAAASLPGDLPRDDPQNYDPHAGYAGD